MINSMPKIIIKKMNLPMSKMYKNLYLKYNNDEDKNIYILYEQNLYCLELDAKR